MRVSRIHALEVTYFSHLEFTARRAFASNRAHVLRAQWWRRRGKNIFLQSKQETASSQFSNMVRVVLAVLCVLVSLLGFEARRTRLFIIDPNSRSARLFLLLLLLMCL